MDVNQQLTSQLVKFRRWTFVAPLITVITFLLVLSCKPDRNLQVWVQYSTVGPKAKEQHPLPKQCSRGHVVPQGRRLSLVNVKGTKTLLVSAYREHRTGTKEVRVISVVLRSETVQYHCLLCCQDHLRLSRGVGSVHSDHFDFAYGTADIMCPLPSGCENTTHVSVVSAADSFEDEDLEFLEVKNQKPGEKFPHNFTVCLSTMFDFTNKLQLVQSLEMFKLLGVNRVGIYLTSCSPEIQHMLDYYSETGLVEVIPWAWSRYLNVSRSFTPSLGPGDLHYFGQIPALNDCVYRYMYQSRYVALQDIDELILPQTVSSWSELLPLLEKAYGADKGYMFENVFPITVSRPPPTPQPGPLHSPSWQNVTGVNILAHLYQEPILKKTEYMNFKVIVNPRAVFTPSVHGLLKSQKGRAWVHRSIARMYHTRSAKQTHLKPEQLIYDGRLLSYSEQLIPAVDAVLRASGLAP